MNISVPSSFATTRALKKECFQAGECRNSYYTEGEFVSDEYACLDFCNSRLQECNWFTYFPRQRFCQLFANCSTLDSVFCEDCLSGQQGCVPPEPTCWAQGECEGTIDRVVAASSKEDCLRLCQVEPSCRWFTFYEPSSLCILMKNCPTIDESCTTCVSGERRCKGPSMVKLSSSYDITTPRWKSFNF